MSIAAGWLSSFFFFAFVRFAFLVLRFRSERHQRCKRCPELLGDMATRCLSRVHCQFVMPCEVLAAAHCTNDGKQGATVGSASRQTCHWLIVLGAVAV